jgi:hypothetical protein
MLSLKSIYNIRCKNLITLQQKVSLYAKWFQWILSEFTGLVNKD